MNMSLKASISAFRSLKVGDKVTRLLSSARIPMPLVVVRGTQDRITCALGPVKEADIDEGSCWHFDRDTGAEEDAELGWGVQYGTTGSFLESPTDSQWDV